MSTHDKSQSPEVIHKGLPSPEETAKLMEKASKVSSGLSALKRQTMLRPFVGKSADGLCSVLLRGYRIESLNVDESIMAAPAQEILPRLCEAHGNAVDKMDDFAASRCAALAKAAGITGDFEMPL